MADEPGKSRAFSASARGILAGSTWRMMVAGPWVLFGAPSGRPGTPGGAIVGSRPPPPGLPPGDPAGGASGARVGAGEGVDPRAACTCTSAVLIVFWSVAGRLASEAGRVDRGSLMLKETSGEG